MLVRRSLSSAGAAATKSASCCLPTKKTSLVVRIGNHAGALERVLHELRDVNLTRIESRPATAGTINPQGAWDVYIDAQVPPLEGKASLPLQALACVCLSVNMLDPMHVPWFPRYKADLDAFTHQTLDAGAELASDHPGFTDQVYRDRRAQIVANAKQYKSGYNNNQSDTAIPSVQYTDEETKTWSLVYQELEKRFPRFACSEFLDVFRDLERCGLYSAGRIPQLAELSPWLESRTGFTLRPVGGLLSARDFLNGLAVKTFHSTQYIRHSSRPFYTPEPDVVHELMGHVPMLGNAEFAALSHDIGLASLGASESDIKRLATLYWFSVEFGLTKEAGQAKAYGAGLLSSFGELEYACSGSSSSSGDAPPVLLDWDPAVASETEYPITTFQPKYFVAQSLAAAAESTRRFCASAVMRPFYAKFEDGRIVTVDRDVVRSKGGQVEAAE